MAGPERRHSTDDVDDLKCVFQSEQEQACDSKTAGRLISEGAPFKLEHLGLFS